MKFNVVLFAVIGCLIFSGLTYSAQNECPKADEAFKLRLAGQRRQAIQLLKDTTDKNAETYFELARNYFVLSGLDKKNTQFAKKYISRALKLSPDSRYYYWAGVIEIHDAIGAGEELLTAAFAPLNAMGAVGKLEKAVKLDPSNKHARLLLVGLYRRIPWYLGGGTGKAEKQVEKLEKLDYLYYCRGMDELYGLKKVDKGIEVWLEAIEKKPHDPFFKEGLAYAYIEKATTQSLEKAHDVLKKAAKENSRTVVMMFELGKAYMKKDMFSHAKTVFEQILEYRKDAPSLLESYAKLQLAKIAHYQGKSAKYNQLMQKASEIDPQQAEMDWLPDVVFLYDLFEKP